ncbi:hypothetical protein CY34DRAFT_325675 [Suillus luteus UH-Slu-Lm8-n1]|uniref:Uncharacterized protein n=1 Tax=Suillus luteus UH-Slu-Lm8-n1 TaxID=930992 RepID=A0A0C9ZPK9_9AGAM|nr:hypothetical protein CY34DRAFT_325675 [Suillus luteus UH-Slu-Lm8-n1]
MVRLLRPTAPQMYATPSHPENFVKWRVNAIIGKCVFSGFDEPFVAGPETGILFVMLSSWVGKFELS